MVVEIISNKNTILNCFTNNNMDVKSNYKYKYYIVNNSNELFRRSKLLNLTIQNLKCKFLLMNKIMFLMNFLFLVKILLIIFLYFVTFNYLFIKNDINFKMLYFQKLNKIISF